MMVVLAKPALEATVLHLGLINLVANFVRSHRNRYQALQEDLATPSKLVTTVGRSTQTIFTTASVNLAF